MKNKCFIIIAINLLYGCASVSSEVTSYDFGTELNSLINNHCQNVTITYLETFLSSKKNSEIEKDFLRFYIYCYTNDPVLEKYISNESVLNKNTNIYSLLLDANKASDSTIFNSYIEKAKKIDSNNIYVLNEIFNSVNDLKIKETCLKKMTEISPDNEFVLIHNIESKRLNNDSVEYHILLNRLKSQYDNYYANLIIASEYVSQSKIDSAVFFYKKSINQKESIDACVDISRLSLFYYKDIETSNYYFQKAKKMNSDNEDILSIEAWLNFYNNDTLNARKVFDKLILTNPSIENKKDFLLLLLCSNRINMGKVYYMSNIKDLLSPEESVGYFLVFEKLKLKSSDEINNYFTKSDSIQKIYGLKPLDYANKIIEAILETR